MGQSALPTPPLFRIGQDRLGRWVVQDQQGLRGGLFVDRAEALRFAMAECGNRREAVVVVAEVIELDLRSAVAGHDAVPAQQLKRIARAARRDAARSMRARRVRECSPTTDE